MADLHGTIFAYLYYRQGFRFGPDAGRRTPDATSGCLTCNFR